MNIKPAELRTGHTTNEEKDGRSAAEESLKVGPINSKPPKNLSASGKKLYKAILSMLPDGFLTVSDVHIITIVSESLDRMQVCQDKINREGLFVKVFDEELPIENPAVKTYERYAKMFEKFVAKLGLSPKDRAALAAMIVKDKNEKDDELLKALRGE